MVYIQIINDWWILKWNQIGVGVGHVWFLFQFDIGVDFDYEEKDRTEGRYLEWQLHICWVE